MKRLLSFTAFVLTLLSMHAQGLIHIGDNAPKYHFLKVINAPYPSFDLKEIKSKPIVLAFWGTWCAPCIPEITKLGKLQKQFGDKVQIIAVSNDNENKLKYFLQKRPSKIWFASDPSDNLWNIFGLVEADHSALIDKNGKVVSITTTDLVDSSVIQKLINEKSIALKQNRGSQVLSRNVDPINLDSSTIYSFVIQPELKGISSMMKRPNSGVFANRRITIINLVPFVILKEAFGISTIKRVVFNTKQDSVTSFEDPLCVDLIIFNNDKKRLETTLQKELNNHLPVKGELQKRIVPCYTLRPIEGKKLFINETSDSTNNYFANGLAFEGQDVPMKTVVSYLENELHYPIYDATGLTKHYNIKFSKNNIEPLQSSKENLAKLGLELVEDKKEMDVLVISSR